MKDFKLPLNLRDCVCWCMCMPRWMRSMKLEEYQEKIEHLWFERKWAIDHGMVENNDLYYPQEVEGSFIKLLYHYDSRGDHQWDAVIFTNWPTQAEALKFILENKTWMNESRVAQLCTQRFGVRFPADVVGDDDGVLDCARFWEEFSKCTQR